MIQPSGFQLTGSLYAKKNLPTLADNLTKVWGTHTLKAGFYYEKTANNQPTNNNANGEMIFANWGGNSVGNAYADLLLGNAQQYVESNKDVLVIMAYNTFDTYATDSWKVSKRLTLDYGMRFAHLGPWNDSNGTGLAIFDPSKYSASAVPTALTGIEWNKIDSGVPPVRHAFTLDLLRTSRRCGMGYVWNRQDSVARRLRTVSVPRRTERTSRSVEHHSGCLYLQFSDRGDHSPDCCTAGELCRSGQHHGARSEGQPTADGTELQLHDFTTARHGNRRSKCLTWAATANI